MYRPFMICDDPKGVVECATIRKTKSGFPKEQKNPNGYLSLSADKEDTVSKRVINEYHKRAQKLNQIRESLPKWQEDGDRSKVIAKELSKEAFDLQESLAMLRKLQEASHYMSRLKKRHKERSETLRINDIEPQNTNSYPFGDQNFQVEFKRRRFLGDGTSKDCIEELKRVLTDSVAEQNLLPKTTSQKNPYLDTSNVPSTCSIKSSVNDNYSHSTDSSLPETVPQRGKGSNLIAKLMGLEDIPMQPLQKKMEKQRTPKPQPVRQKADLKQRTLEKIRESMHLRGKSKSHQAIGFLFKERLVGEVQPIVLVKPCAPCREPEETIATIVWEEEALKTKMMSRKLKVKEKLMHRSEAHEVRGLNGSGMYSKNVAEEFLFRKLGQEGASGHKELNQPEEKEIKTVVHEEVTMRGSISHRKLEAEEIPTKRSQGKVIKAHKEVVVRSEEQKAKTVVKSTSMVKATEILQQQKKERTKKKITKIQKVVDVSQEAAEKEIVKPARVTSTKQRKPETGVMSAKTQLSEQRSIKPKTILKHKIQSTVYDSKDQKKKAKPLREPAPEKPTNANLGREEDDKSTDLFCDCNSVSQETNNVPADQVSIEDSNASEIQTQDLLEENCCDNESSSNIASPTIEYEEENKASEQVSVDVTCSEGDEISFKSGSKLKALLLNSAPFHNHEEELFDLNNGSTQILPASVIDEWGITDTKLSLDYANEFIELRSLSYSQARHPFLPTLKRSLSRIPYSLGQLVEEICNGIEVLRGSCVLPHDGFSAETLYATLERDMNYTVVSRTWEWGWRSGSSVEEAEQTLKQIERLLVNDLVEEAVCSMF